MPYSTEVLADNPNIFLRLGETSGTIANDETANNADGTYEGGFTLNQTGPITGDPGAVFLNGSTGWINLGNPSSAQVTGIITLEVCVKFAAFPTTTSDANELTFASLATKGYDGSNEAYTLRVHNVGGNRTLQFGSYNGTDFGVSYPASGMQTGIWYHIVANYDGVNARIFLNGVQVASAAQSFGAFSSSRPLIIGGASSNFANSRFLNGTIANFALYSTALSGARILAHYNQINSGAPDSIAPTLDSAAVPEDGSCINVFFSEPVVSVTKSGWSIMSDGQPVAVSSVSGGGSSWKLELGRRWIIKDSSVTLAYSSGGIQDFSSNLLAAFSYTPVANASKVLSEAENAVGLGVGAFIHFSINTFLNVEWSDGSADKNVFSPTSLDCSQWARSIKSMGGRFAIFTTKHHDGFCTWRTNTSTYGVKDTTWGISTGRDPVSEFCSACRAEGIRVHLYFSVWDRRWEGFGGEYSYSTLTQLITAQLGELLTKYGVIDSIWLDAYSWQVGYSAIPFETMRGIIKALQPNCVIVENNHENNLNNTEIVSFERAIDGLPSTSQRYPCEVSACFNAGTVPSSGFGVPGGGWWYWHPPGTSGLGAIVDADAVASDIITINSRRGSYVQNVPPDTSGKIPTEFALRMAEIGSNVLSPGYYEIQTASSGSNGGGNIIAGLI